MPSEYCLSAGRMDMKSPAKLDVDVNLNHLMVRRPRTPTSPNPLDNDELKRCSTGLSAFNDYVDLVKRHLMYAVREEVEILKQQIGEMGERIGQLEYENTVLRAEAKPETLNKLLLPRVTQAQPTSALPAPTSAAPAPQQGQQSTNAQAPANHNTQNVTPQSQTQIHVQTPAQPVPQQQVQPTPGQQGTHAPSQGGHPPST
ncbi:unnamed protein product [Lymnaea stagnalis]|uniref:Uncharacterized protein n=1 Tax=Lymnaea stagnalis TaxID=6523 RepID=A0AAV2H535_LYMST